MGILILKALIFDGAETVVKTLKAFILDFGLSCVESAPALEFQVFFLLHCRDATFD